MKDVVISLANGADATTLSAEELAKVVTAEADDFSKFMETFKDWKYSGPLTKAERVLLQTYIAQKLLRKMG